MTMRYIFTLLNLLAFLGCSKEDNSMELGDSSAVAKVYTAATLDEFKTMYSINTYITAQAEESKTETIDFDCAILIYPTDEQIEEMKKTMGDQEFYAVTEESNWYQGRAFDLLDSLHIKKVTANARYLRLKGLNGVWILDIRKQYLPSWNLILFKTVKEPKIVLTAGLTGEQAEEYFGSANKKPIR